MYKVCFTTNHFVRRRTQTFFLLFARNWVLKLFLCFSFSDFLLFFCCCLVSFYFYLFMFDVHWTATYHLIISFDIYQSLSCGRYIYPFIFFVRNINIASIEEIICRTAAVWTKERCKSLFISLGIYFLFILFNDINFHTCYFE